MRVQHTIGHLDIHTIVIQENGAQQPNFFDGVWNAFHINSITDIERVAYEKEDDTRQNI